MVLPGTCLVLGLGAGFEPRRDRDRPQGTQIRAQGCTYDLPDLIANPDTDGRETVHLRLAASLQFRGAANLGAVQRRMPYLMDEMQTHLRALTPAELEGAKGTRRMKTELLRRVNRAVAPQHVDAVLIREMVVQ